MERVNKVSIWQLLVTKQIKHEILITLVVGLLILVMLYPFLLFLGLVPYWKDEPPVISIWWLAVSIIGLGLLPRVIVKIIRNTEKKIAWAWGIFSAKSLYIEINPSDCASKSPLVNLYASYDSGDLSSISIDMDTAYIISGESYKKEMQLFEYKKNFSEDATKRFKKFVTNVNKVREILKSSHRASSLMESDEFMLQKMMSDYAHLLSWSDYSDSGNESDLLIDKRRDIENEIIEAQGNHSNLNRLEENLKFVKVRINQVQERAALRKDAMRELDALDHRIDFINDSLSVQSHGSLTERLYVPGPILDELQKTYSEFV